ncbi:acyltransferase domain-containing protein, partial [Crossiella sp. SN42]|uniref:acyltransferase domain-containing protein n=1 Tax=Crossiella sp. SN42 TaxID=2944808 RepID=UPI00207C7AE8
VLPLLTAGVSIAAVNTPTSVVVSGNAEEVEALRDCGFRTNQLTVSHAFHSAHLDPILDEFATVARELTYHEPRIPVITNLTGEIATTLTDPQHWVQHVRGTVRFADGLATLADRGITHLIEVGPHPALIPMAQEALGERAPVLIALAQRRKPQQRRLLAGLAKLWVSGIPVRWPELLPPGQAELPTYPFRRTRFWLRTRPPRTKDVLHDALHNADLDKVSELLELTAPEQRTALAALLPAFADWYRREQPPLPEETEPDNPLAGLPAAERLGALLELIQRQTADVLGHHSTGLITPDRSLLELGLSSFSLLELRNRLVTATGLLLPAKALLEHPTAGQLAEHINALLATDSAEGAHP